MPKDQITLIEELIDKSLYFEATQQLKSLLEQDATNLKLQQLLALSYSRSGALEDALTFFEPIYLANKSDAEVSGIMGGIYKRLFKKHQDQKYGVLASTIYENNYVTSQNPYTGINAASMLSMTGKSMKGKAIAREIIANHAREQNDIWSLATLGEAYLLIKDYEASRKCYIAARKMINNKWSQLGTIYKQLWLLDHYLLVPKNIMQLFLSPKVTVFSGHMIDHPNRKNQRFTSAMELSIKDAIKSAIDTMNVQIGYSSLACGADILFVESLLEQGKTVHILLPFDKEDFIKESVGFAGEQWVTRFNAILNEVEPIYISTSEFSGKNEAFEFLSKVLLGMGILHAEQIDSDANLLTVLSSVSLEAKRGGTRYLEDLWPDKLQRFNVDVEKYFIPVEPKENDTKSEVINFNPALAISYMTLLRMENIELASQYHVRIEAFLLEESIDYHTTELIDDTIIIHFKNELNAMDSLREINNFYNHLNHEAINSEFPTILFHAGHVLTNTTGYFEGEDLGLAKKIIKIAPTSHISMSENFTSCVSLKGSKWSIDYAGKLELGPNQFSSIFNIDRSNFL